MANVIINGITYSNCPEVDIPEVNGGTARFVDTSDANATSGDMRSGKSGYVDGSKVNGSIQDKAAATYTPTTYDQTISAGQYLAGDQTVKGDVNLIAQNIADGVTIFGITGSLSSPTISQDATTKILSIS